MKNLRFRVISDLAIDKFRTLNAAFFSLKKQFPLKAVSLREIAMGSDIDDHVCL